MASIENIARLIVTKNWISNSNWGKMLNIHLKGHGIETELYPCEYWLQFIKCIPKDSTKTLSVVSSLPRCVIY